MPQKNFAAMLLASAALLTIVSQDSPAVPRNESGDAHRLLLLDIGQERGGDNQRLFVLEIESGKVLAETRIGMNSNTAVSARGNAVAVIQRDGLAFYQARDLERLEHGLPPPISWLTYQYGAGADVRLSPNGQEFIVQDVESKGPSRLATTVLNCVLREKDGEGRFKLGRKTVRVPRTYGVEILRVNDWPKVHLWNRSLGLLEVVDFDSGKILSKTTLGDDPVLDNLDPTELEKEKNADLIFQRRFRGGPVTDGGRYAYYVPSQGYSQDGERRETGFLKKVDLTPDPPKVIVRTKDRQRDLSIRSGAVSEPAGTLFVLQSEVRVQFAEVPLQRVKRFRTDDLAFTGNIDLPLADCRGLQVSPDGKYLYALDSKAAKLAVFDAFTGRLIKVLDRLRGYVHVMLPF